MIVAPQEGRVRRLLEILDVPSLAYVCDSLEEALQVERQPGLTGAFATFAYRTNGKLNGVGQPRSS